MLIGLCGAAGAGKGSVADVLVRRFGFSEIAFADPLYAAASAMLEVPVNLLKDRTYKEQPIEWLGRSPREVLQLMGTDFGRKMLKESIWVDLCMRRADTLRRYGGVVIADVRFDNEAEAIRAAGGTVWRVARESPSCLAGEAARHESEAGVSLGLVDLTIRNDGTLADLDAAVQNATERYNKRSGRMDCAHDRRDETVNH